MAAHKPRNGDHMNTFNIREVDNGWFVEINGDLARGGIPVGRRVYKDAKEIAALLVAYAKNSHAKAEANAPLTELP